MGRSDTYEFGNTACQVYIELECKDLDLDRLNSAWNYLIQRHDMLRAIVKYDGTQQILENVSPYTIEIEDLRGKTGREADDRISRIRATMAQYTRPADEWPLFEIGATVLSDTRTRIHICIDQLIADAYSIQILFYEWVKLYENPEPRFPFIELSFRDYVIAEKRLKNSGEYARSEKFWLDRLDTLPPAPPLPLLQQKNRLQTLKFLRRRFQLEKEHWETFKQRALSTGVTPSVVFIAAYAEILALWSGKNAFTINLTVFNRHAFHPQVMDIVGEVTSISLLEINRLKEVSFQERTRSINEQLWEDMDHLLFNGINVIRELSRKQGDSSNVIMPVVFTSTTNLEKVDGEKHDLRRFGHVAYSITQTPQVWLDNQVTEENGFLSISWDALEDIFPEGVLDHMFHAYTSLIVRLAEEEDLWQKSTLVTLPNIQLECRTKINATEGPVSEKTLYNLFEDQALQRLKQSAVVTPEYIMDYEELFNRSNFLGQLLHEQGAGPGKLVAIVMDKGWEQVVATLGILRAGAAYLPISSDSPQKRIWELLQIGEADMVLTQSWLNETMEWPENLNRFSVDTLPTRWDQKNVLPVIQDSQSLAYVIFTSGSTGFPKGVMIDNRGAVNTVLDVNRRFGINARDRVLALSNLSFDLSVYDIFGTLAAGGTIVMPGNELAKDPSHWASLIQKERVTIWNSVPASMGMMMAYITGKTTDSLKTLRLIFLSGDWIPLKLPGKIKSRISEATIVSLGGATEASIWSVFYPVESVKSEWASIPYGRPMTNQSLHILNESMEECPDMVPGQLYIGGIGLALGYWQDEVKTTEAFIHHPVTGKRLYRTGDLGRYLPDGNIQFIGREDLQVKINGHRIELEEIETALKKHSGVGAAVAIPAGDPHEKRHLVAYVVPDKIGMSNRGRKEKKNGSGNSFVWESSLIAGAMQAESPGEINIDRFSFFSNELNRLALGCICNTFKLLNLFCEDGEEYSAREIISTHTIQSRYLKLLERWLSVMSAEGLLEKKGKKYISAKALPDYSVNDSWHQLQRWQLNDTEQGLFNYFKQCCDNLTGLLKGDTDPLELLFPEGSWQTAENLYQMNSVSQYYNSIIREIVRSISNHSTQAKPLRIMEIGAGTGGTTESILPVLNPDEVMYHYTDISHFFLNKAKKKFHAFPFVQYKLFDINESPRVQNFQTGNYDVIIAANVLHDANNVENTLSDLQSLLVPGGVLLILETTRNDTWQMVSVAFIEGLNVFKDERVKENLPLLSVEKWCEKLNKMNFINYIAFPVSDSPCSVFGQHVIMAQTTQSENRLERDDLNRFLDRELPPYMIPSSYIFLDAMPLTPNGKIDRKALSSLPGSVTKADVAKEYEAPRNALEKKLSNIWSELLDMDKVGINDDFFKLGGDSLLITQLLVKIRDTIDSNVDWEQALKRIFETPTVKGVAEFFEAEGKPLPVNNTKAGSPLVRMKSKGARQPFFLISDGRGNLLEYRDFTTSFEADRPLYGLEVNDIDKYLKGHSQIEDMASEYVMAIQDVQAEGPYALGGYCMGGIIALEMARQLQYSGQRVEHLIMISSYKPSFIFDDDILLFHIFARELSISLAETDFALTDSEFEKIGKIIADNGLSSLESASFRKILAEDETASFREKYFLLEKLTLEKRLALLFDLANSNDEDKLGNMSLTQFQRMFSIYQTSFMAVGRYEPVPYQGKVTFMKPMEKTSFGRAKKVDELLVWSDIALQGFTVHDIPGNHQTCLEMPNVVFLTGLVEKVLSQSDF
jgi:yersiniabactin nonribosomal peptide synthetase